MPTEPQTPGERTGDQTFRSEDLSRDLRERTVRSGAASLMGQAVKFLLNAGAIVVLARLLTPADFGLVAMVQATIGIFGMFTDLGLRMATVQSAEINHRQVTTLFWINVATAAFIVCCIAVLAPGLARFYEDGRLTGMTWALSSTYLFVGLTAQHQALLRRHMRFKGLALMESGATLAAILVAIGLAWGGAAYWALVGLNVTRAATVAVSAWFMSAWRPGMPGRGAGIGGMLRFGGFLTASRITNYLSRNLDKILIGYYVGAGPLGLYAKAYDWVVQPLQQANIPFSNVALSTLSRIQGDSERYRRYYRMGILLISAPSMAIIAFLFVDAEELVLTMLGSQWTGVVPLLRILAVGVFVGKLGGVTRWIYLSLGHTDRMFRWGVFEALCVTVAFFVGIRWGAIGIAWANAIVLLALWVPSVTYCFKGTPIRLRLLFSAIWRPAVSAIAAGAGLHACRSAYGTRTHVPVQLVMDAVVYVLLFALVWLALPHGRRQAHEMWAAGRLVWQKASDTGAEKAPGAPGWQESRGGRPGNP